MNEIELKLSEQAFQWLGKDGGWKTGFRLTDPTRSDVPEVVIMYEPKGNRFVKIPFADVSIYPSEPIPEPTK